MTEQIPTGGAGARPNLIDDVMSDSASLVRDCLPDIVLSRSFVTVVGDGIPDFWRGRRDGAVQSTPSLCERAFDPRWGGGYGRLVMGREGFIDGYSTSDLGSEKGRGCFCSAVVLSLARRSPDLPTVHPMVC